MNPAYISFVLYLVGMIFIGVWFMRKSGSTISEYLLGGRGIGSWVTAMSAQASDMSGWLIMGLPGAIYLLNSTSGLGDVWCAAGLALGTWANWHFTAPRLRIYSGLTGSLTVTAYLANRFRDPRGLIRMTGAAVTLFFFTIYAGSGLMAAGKLFESLFGMDYRLAVVIGAVVILSYTFMGGYLAVCWTDLIQGLLMFCALIVVPVCAVRANADIDFIGALRARNITCFPNGVSFAAILAILSPAVWGLGYFG